MVTEIYYAMFPFPRLAFQSLSDSHSLRSASHLMASSSVCFKPCLLCLSAHSLSLTRSLALTLSPLNLLFPSLPLAFFLSLSPLRFCLPIPALREAVSSERRQELEREFQSVPTMKTAASELPPNVAHLNRCKWLSSLCCCLLLFSLSFPCLTFSSLLFSSS